MNSEKSIMQTTVSAESKMKAVGKWFVFWVDLWDLFNFGYGG